MAGRASKESAFHIWKKIKATGWQEMGRSRQAKLFAESSLCARDAGHHGQRSFPEWSDWCPVGTEGNAFN